MDRNIKPITEETVIYARPHGWHYHIDRNCGLLINRQFEFYGYAKISLEEVKKRNLKPCPGCVMFKRGK